MMFFKLRQGASIGRFVGRSVGLSVSPSVRPFKKVLKPIYQLIWVRSCPNLISKLFGAQRMPQIKIFLNWPYLNDF